MASKLIPENKQEGAGEGENSIPCRGNITGKGLKMKESLTLEKLKFTVAKFSVLGNAQGCGWRGKLHVQTSIFVQMAEVCYIDYELEVK